MDLSSNDTEEGARAEKAYEFACSVRGQYILSQALHYAIEALQAVPEERQEKSNISDMMELRECVFGLFDPSFAELAQIGQEILEEQAEETATEQPESSSGDA